MCNLITVSKLRTGPVEDHHRSSTVSLAHASINKFRQLVSVDYYVEVAYRLIRYDPGISWAVRHRRYKRCCREDLSLMFVQSTPSGCFSLLLMSISSISYTAPSHFTNIDRISKS